MLDARPTIRDVEGADRRYRGTAHSPTAQAIFVLISTYTFRRSIVRAMQVYNQKMDFGVCTRFLSSSLR